MREIADLVRPEILDMEPYGSARSEGGDGARIFLDANENPYPPYPGTGGAVGLNRYPEPQPTRLLDLFEELYGTPRERLLLSRGADEAIDLLVRAFCRPGVDGVVTCPPTFGMYATAARIQGAAVHGVPLVRPGFALDAAGVLACHAAHPTVRLVFVCSPNNPTGNLMDRRDVLRLADGLLGRALVVVDELYVGYSGRPSLAAEVAGRPNLVVLRSVSKEWSLAGERVGVTVAHPEVVAVLRRVAAPYPLAVSAVRAVEAALSPEGVRYGRENVNRIVAERERVRGRLGRSPAVEEVFPSDANFLLVRVADARGLVEAMRARGIRVRDRSGAVAGAVRITVGTPAENGAVLAALDDYGRPAVRMRRPRSR